MLMVAPEHVGAVSVAMLLAAAERMALSAGKTLLVLDTVTGSDAERCMRGRAGSVAGKFRITRCGPLERPARPRFFSNTHASTRTAQSAAWVFETRVL
jgi:hypothetical protein